MFGVDQLPEAFEAVVRSTHPGRVALDFTTPSPAVKPAEPELVVRPDARYLVTGGFGSFGLVSAGWLAEASARHLVLAGRRGASTDDARTRVAALRAVGVRIEEAQLDISDRDAVRALVDGFAADGPPLRGVLHAAGVIDDQPVATITRASIAGVMEPKVLGALHLHEATVAAGCELDLFVLFSSVVALTGTVPQLSYAAANATLDAIAGHRHAAGLAATSLNWGALAGGGMAEATEEVARYLELLGVRSIDMRFAARAMAELLRFDAVQVGLVDVDWARVAAANPATARTPRFATSIAEAQAGASGAQALHDELLAMPEEERREVLGYMLAEQLASVLGVPAETIELDTPLPDLGLDSLMAVELGARVNLSLGLELSALELIRGLSLSALAAHVMPALIGGGGRGPSPAEPSEDGASPATARQPAVL